MDIVDHQTRSRMMSGIRGKDTQPEIAIRRCLFAHGFRYRLHATGLPGRPDMVLAKYRAIVFIHGCFWHGHDCRLFRMPASNRRFWSEKIRRNRARDRKVLHDLTRDGWRTLIIWECAIRGLREPALARVCRRTARWIVSRSKFLEIRERHARTRYE